MKIENLSMDYTETMFDEPVNATNKIRTGGSKKRRGGYISFRVVLDGDETIDDFHKLANKVKNILT